MTHISPLTDDALVDLQELPLLLMRQHVAHHILSNEIDSSACGFCGRVRPEEGGKGRQDRRKGAGEGRGGRCSRKGAGVG